MARGVLTIFLAGVGLIVFLASVDLHQLRVEPLLSAEELRAPPNLLYYRTGANYAIQEEAPEQEVTRRRSRRATSVPDSAISTFSILLPAWELLVIVSPETPLPSDSATSNYTCLFPNNVTSPARPAGTLSSPDRSIFKCDLPVKLRRRSPFPQPILTRHIRSPPESISPAPGVLRWDFLVYDSLSTEKDVVLFVKGLNRRQGSYRAPSEFRCVFGAGSVSAVKTAVTTSVQEVFRCQLPLPDLNAVSFPVKAPIKVSIEISEQNQVVPSVAYYSPPRQIASQKPKSLLCACTMVYNAAKFLKEWIVYHAAIGVEKFILYDNNSDDDLHKVVEELLQLGYDVSTLLWIWPKTQEAGFSHCAMFAKEACTWMMFIDIDEFVYSPSWHISSNASPEMLKSFLPQAASTAQVIISCYEFGPSNQKSHPLTGVTQGYDCRRRVQDRHKSIVLLDAIDESLLNVVHHFRLKEDYKGMRLRKEELVVNHYKYQAWSEFRTKFRRRVSAYVADWTQAVNPGSNDRAPGLGYEAVEPKGWAEKFCEVHDDRLKNLTKRWKESSSYRYKMAWQ